MIAERLICVLAGYVCGNFPSGVLIAKKKNVDIRRAGSGNTGATNTLRVLGKKAGAVVLVLDILKCLIPALLTYFYFSPEYPEMAHGLLLYTGFGAIVGHNYPAVMKFKGGKGIACTGAVVIAYDYRLAILGILLFVAVTYFTGYVSVASLAGVTICSVLIILSAFLGWYPMNSTMPYEITVLCLLITALAFWRHRGNIQRLLNGTENKMVKKGK